eukprot:jgi/Orpsp1_1/1187431/evm.model.d7180000057646.1
MKNEFIQLVDNNTSFKGSNIAIDCTYHDDNSNVLVNDERNTSMFDNEEKQKENEIKNSNVKNQRKRIYWLDALRVFACYLVIITHSTGHFINKNDINKNETLEFKFNKGTIYHVLCTVILGNGHALWYLKFVIGLYISTPIIKAITENQSLILYSVILFSTITQFIPTL